MISRSAKACTSTGRPTALAATEYLFESKHQIGLQDGCMTEWKPSKRPV
jgi:hypothetical protein